MASKVLSYTSLALLLAAPALAQSANPGLGVNNASMGATARVRPGSGPNGAESWFNRGMDGDGWNPPFLSFDKLIHVDRDTFYSDVGSACEEFDQYFSDSGAQYNIDPVILAIIAMQESSCNPYAGGPTPGLMQVACENYPDGQCTDSLADNVDAGTHYLRLMLDQSDNNAIVAFAQYNGWFQAGTELNGGKGLTDDYPCSDEGQSNGQPQNLDYVQEILNGWLTGLNPYGDDYWIGTYDCAGNCDSGLC